MNSCIDVVVTDAKGKPVTGLTRDDFQLFEDGVEKPISNVSGFAGGGQAILPVQPVPATEQSEQPAQSGQAGLPVLHSRKFIVYVDEMSLAAPTAKKLRSELASVFRPPTHPLLPTLRINAVQNAL